MHHPKALLPTRRHLIKGLAVALTALALAAPATMRAASARGETAANGFRVLRARQGSVRLRGADQPETSIWGYDGQVPGPTLRLRRGEELKVRLINDLPEPTLVHWHGLRLPNSMDGVPHLTQAPVEPGQSFDYRFTAPDAGTFWYHSRLYSSEQLERGLYGPLIVHETQPIDVDRDLVLVLDDWRLGEDGAIHASSFRSTRDAAHAGRLGRMLTVNSQHAPHIPVRTNERLRLRLVNAANARVLALRIEGHAAWVMAIDGQPAEPFLAREGRIALGPGSRIDLFVDATRTTGEKWPIVADLGAGTEAPVAYLTYEPGEKLHPAPRNDPAPLPANPLPTRIDFRSAFRLEVPLEGGAMSAGYAASSGHSGPALFSVKRGRAVLLAFRNNTAFPHAMHLHGHHFRLLDNLDDGWKPFWLDTVLLNPGQTTRIAFVADNPGKWLIHCPMLDHPEASLAAWFHVT